jgi:hypothetical protein
VLGGCKKSLIAILLDGGLVFRLPIQDQVINLSVVNIDLSVGSPSAIGVGEP